VSTTQNQPTTSPIGPPRAADHPDRTGASAAGSVMFSGAPAAAPVGGPVSATEQLNLRIRADLYRQLDRTSVLLSARRGVPTNRVTVVEEALAAYFEANRSG